jgi:hypothetical protein
MPIRLEPHRDKWKYFLRHGRESRRERASDKLVRIRPPLFKFFLLNSSKQRETAKFVMANDLR